MPYGVNIAASLLAFWCALQTASGDTPANCTYEDILGTWQFSIGTPNFDRTVDCSAFGANSVASTLTVQLVFPDKAVDQYGNVGFWTIIYNQGFEVQIANKKYFAFSNYTMSGQNVTSYCHSTFNGWSHDFWGHNWACYFGEKIGGGHIGAPREKHSSMKRVADLTIKYVENQGYVEQINSHQNLWTATVYPEMVGMTLAGRLRRAGGVPLPTDQKPRTTTSSSSRDTLKLWQQLPSSFDWRNVNGVNYVSPIRDQAECGSCYAFGSMALIEARLRIATNNRLQPVFSPQDVVSCSAYAQGCEGGFPYLIAGKYAEDFGVVEESCFPYSGQDGPCTETKGCQRYYGTNYFYVGGFYGGCNEQEMMVELANNGPIAVSFEVYDDFLHYKGGIYQHTGLEDKFNPWEITNHVVLVVGYGEENGTPYWIVKNSWGTSWGEDGFFRILRGADECSIESIAVAMTPLIP